MMMRARTCIVIVCVYASLVCNANASEKRSRNVWHQERLTHTGAGLSDKDLHALSSRKNHDHFLKVLEPLLLPRVVGSENHATVRKHIASSMENLGWDVEQNTFKDSTPLGKKDFTNIIATLDPNAARRLVLACHYDSKYMGEQIFVGATDSSVPCAMMLNLAYILNAEMQQHKLKRYDVTLQLIFFDGEEAFRTWTATDSIYGSRHMAERMQNTAYPPGNQEGLNELHRIDMLILLDLLGTKTSTFYNFFKETKDWYSRMISFEQRFTSLNLLAKKQTMFQNKNFYQGGIEDDHIPFLKRGVPILHLIPVPFPSVWHKISDNASALDHDSIDNLNKIIRAFVVDYLHLVL